MNRPIQQTTSIEVSKRIISLALPMAGVQFINVISGFLCMAMLASLGSDVLSASALIFTTQQSIMVTGMSILFSLSVLVSHAYGAKKYEVIGNYLQQGWTLSFIIGVPIMLLFWHMDKLLIYFGQSETVVDIVQIYFHAYCWAVIPAFLSVCNMQFGYGIHKKTLIVSISMMGIVVLMIAAYILIFGKLGLPKLGTAGLGYANLIQYVFFFIFTTVFYYSQQSFARFKLFKYRVHENLSHLAHMFRVGWPMCVQMGGEMLSFFVSGLMIGWLGTVALASYQVVNQYYFLIIVPIFSLSQAASMIVGQANGAGQFHEIKKIGYASILIAWVLSAIVAVIFLILPKQLASVYMQINNPLNAETVHLTMMIFAIIAFSQLFDATRHVLIGNLRGLFDTRTPMIMTLISIWVIGMPISYLLAFPLNYGAPGFVWGGLIGMLTNVLIIGFRWFKLNKCYNGTLLSGS